MGAALVLIPLLCVLNGSATLMIRTVSGWAAAGSRIVLGVTLLGHESLQIGYKPNEHTAAWFLFERRVTQIGGARTLPAGA
jgi:hypothetical protein